MTDMTPNQLRVAEMLARMEEAKKLSGSSTFCAAKWLQSTTTLYNGHTHSCHHPSPHRILVEDVVADPSSLHNTEIKKKARAQMLKGERPSECQYCWNVEDLPGNHISDRTYKTADQNWSTPYLDRIFEDSPTPSYLEVAFDNTCNFACAYCSPDVSSKWMEDIQLNGQYPTSWGTGNLDWLRQTGRFPIPQREKNPYVDAFWKWWPDLYPKLHTFRITGGEPLLSKNTWKVLDWIEANPRPDLTLAINTNMDVPDEMISRLIATYNNLSTKIKEIQIFTSCEAHGKDAEYIRYGMSYGRFMGKIKRFLEETGPDSRIGFMMTFNALSVPSFDRFLQDVYDLRVAYNADDSVNRIPMMLSYLRWPPFMNVRILPHHIRMEASDRFRNFVSTRTRATSPHKSGRFYLEEIDQIDRLCDFMLNEETDNLERDHRDFGAFFQAYDVRRGTNFHETFPSLVDFYQSCFTDPGSHA